MPKQVLATAALALLCQGGPAHRPLGGRSGRRRATPRTSCGTARSSRGTTSRAPAGRRTRTACAWSRRAATRTRRASAACAGCAVPARPRLRPRGRRRSADREAREDVDMVPDGSLLGTRVGWISLRRCGIPASGARRARHDRARRTTSSSATPRCSCRAGTTPPRRRPCSSCRTRCTVTMLRDSCPSTTRAGALLATADVSVPQHGVHVLQTASIAASQGKSGSAHHRAGALRRARGQGGRARARDRLRVRHRRSRRWRGEGARRHGTDGRSRCATARRRVPRRLARLRGTVVGPRSLGDWRGRRRARLRQHPAPRRRAVGSRPRGRSARARPRPDDLRGRRRATPTRRASAGSTGTTAVPSRPARCSTASTSPARSSSPPAPRPTTTSTAGPSRTAAPCVGSPGAGPSTCGSSATSCSRSRRSPTTSASTTRRCSFRAGTTPPAADDRRVPPEHDQQVNRHRLRVLPRLEWGAPRDRPGRACRSAGCR